MKDACEKPRVLISGGSLSEDINLIKVLRSFAEIVITAVNERAKVIVSTQRIDLVLMEIGKGSMVDVEIIKRIKELDAAIPIVTVFDSEEEQDLIATAFSFSVKDAFRRPYKIDLLEERIKALLNCVS